MCDAVWVSFQRLCCVLFCSFNSEAVSHQNLIRLLWCCSVCESLLCTQNHRGEKGRRSYFYSPPSHHHPRLLCTPCTKHFGKAILYAQLCVCVCGVCMKDWCWPKYLPGYTRPVAYCVKERGKEKEGGEREGGKEQMPQIEMPINNASYTELTVKGGLDGTERRRLRKSGEERERSRWRHLGFRTDKKQRQKWEKDFWWTGLHFFLIFQVPGQLFTLFY